MSDNLTFLLTCAAECLNNWGYDGHGKHVDDGVKEITRLRERLAEADEANRRVSDENEQLRKDLKTAIMGDSAELQDVKRENEKLREAFEQAANDMRPMLRSMISRGEAAEIVRRAAAAAIRETDAH